MSMIDRYKKRGGFVQLLILIESSPKDKQEKFLQMIAQESPVWESEIRKRLLTMERVLTWNKNYLGEVFPRLQPIHLAMVASTLPADKAAIFMDILNYKERKQVEEILSNKKPTPAESSVGIEKLFAEIRKMVTEGDLKMDKVDPEMVIPENIEEKLSTSLSIVQNQLKQMETYTPEAPPPGTPPHIVEELNNLKRKVVLLAQDNQKLLSENHILKDKLEQIKKIA